MKTTWFEEDRRADGVPIDDRGLQYGDGLFETIAVRLGQPRLWPLHAERLLSGCERLGIVAPATDELRRLVDNAIFSTAEFSAGVVKLIVTRGSGQRGYRFSERARPRVIIGTFEKAVYPVDFWAGGIDIRICSLRLARQPALAGIKSLNRLEQVLARNEWQDASFAEGLMLDSKGNIICGTMSNVFFASPSGLITPAITDAGVCGVMRRHILAIADADGIAASVRPVSMQELENFEEMFLCNSQIGLWPVRRCGSNSLAAPGPVTSRIMALLLASGIEECRR
jgi:4-amino-4-deoxychorismate lyase